MFSLVDTLQTYSCRYICLASSSILFPFLLFFRKKFSFFFFRKRVKFSAISPGLTKRTQLTQPRYHGFSAAFSLAEMACTINVRFSLHYSGDTIWMKNKLVLISIVRLLRTVKIIIVINILNRKQAIQALSVIELAISYFQKSSL